MPTADAGAASSGTVGRCPARPPCSRRRMRPSHPPRPARPPTCLELQIHRPNADPARARCAEAATRRRGGGRAPIGDGHDQTEKTRHRRRAVVAAGTAPGARRRRRRERRAADAGASPDAARRKRNALPGATPPALRRPASRRFRASRRRLGAAASTVCGTEDKGPSGNGIDVHRRACTTKRQCSLHAAPRDTPCASPRRRARHATKPTGSRATTRTRTADP